jgi:putative membrane protein insertion efficiency factor
MKKIVQMAKFILSLPKNLILLLIYIYQKTISPDHGIFKSRFPHGYCRFYPTCSEYSRQVIKKRGILVGIPLALWRILRCNPWSRGGIDSP